MSKNGEASNLSMMYSLWLMVACVLIAFTAASDVSRLDNGEFMPTMPASIRNHISKVVATASCGPKGTSLGEGLDSDEAEASLKSVSPLVKKVVKQYIAEELAKRCALVTSAQRAKERVAAATNAAKQASQKVAKASDQASRRHQAAAAAQTNFEKAKVQAEEAANAAAKLVKNVAVVTKASNRKP